MMPQAIRAALVLFIAVASAAWLGYGYLAMKDARVTGHVTAQAPDRGAVAATSSSAPWSTPNPSVRVDGAQAPSVDAATPRETLALPANIEHAPAPTIGYSDAAAASASVRAPIMTTSPGSGDAHAGADSPVVHWDSTNDPMRPPGDYRIALNGVAEQLRSVPVAAGSNPTASTPERPPVAVSSQ